MSTLIYYEEKLIGTYHKYFSKNSYWDKKPIGYITFEGLNSLTSLLTAPDNDILKFSEWKNMKIKDLKDMIENEYYALYLSTESEIYHEGPSGIKIRNE